MVRGKIWKPRNDGFWHWQLIIWQATRHAHVYSGHEPTHKLALAEMQMEYQLHTVPGVGKKPLIVLGVDNPRVA